MVTKAFSLKYAHVQTVNTLVLDNSLANIQNQNLFLVLLLFDEPR